MCSKDIIDYLDPPLNIFSAQYALMFGSRHQQNTLATVGASLYKCGLFRKLVVSGGLTNEGTRPEAMEIADLLMNSGLPASAIILECNATNTLENVLNTRHLIEPYAESVLLIGKIYAKRRYLMTVKQHWSVPKITAIGVNYFDTQRESWQTSDEFRQRIMVEQEKIPIYLARGDIKEVEIINGGVQ
jgi:uncharacterized SAM-binding protein YcdF (DUF218 family)